MCWTNLARKIYIFFGASFTPCCNLFSYSKKRRKKKLRPTDACNICNFGSRIRSLNVKLQYLQEKTWIECSWSLFIKFYMESITNWYIFCFKNCTDLQKLYIHQADKNGLVSGRVKGQNNFSKLNNFCKKLKEQSGKFIFGNLKYFSHQLCEFLSPSLTFTNLCNE